MPNWVKHEITFTGSKESLDKLQSLATEEKFFDNIIPLPEDLLISAGSAEFTAPSQRFFFIKDADTQIEQMKDMARDNTEAVDNFVKSIKNYIVHGYTSWYPFCIDRWGSKWDACDLIVERDDDSLFMVFNTAWNTVEPIFKKITELFPDITIDGKFADEDVGANCGVIEGKNGNVTVAYFDNGSDEAIAFARELLGIWEEGED